jgi:hypothetical protein
LCTHIEEYQIFTPLFRIQYVKDPTALKQLEKLKMFLFGLNSSPLKKITDATNSNSNANANDQHIDTTNKNHKVNETTKVNETYAKKRALKRTLSDVLKEKREMFSQLDNYELAVNQPLKKRR